MLRPDCNTGTGVPMKRTVIRHDVVQPLDQSIRLIPLTQNQTAIVDACNYECLMEYCWQAQWNPETKGFYAIRHHKVSRTKRSIRIAMHRAVLLAPAGLYTDHINGNSLDNRRENLRIATASINALNTKCSGAKNHRHGRFQARIQVNGKRKSLGIFETKIEAENAVIAEKKKLFQFTR